MTSRPMSHPSDETNRVAEAFTPLEEGPESCELKINDIVSFRFSSSRVETHTPRDGAKLTFPLSYFMLVAHFDEWKPLSSAFMQITDENALRPREAFAFLRKLIESGVLVARQAISGAFCAADFERAAKIWSEWDPSLAYYMASRTREDQPYFALEDLEVLLEEKAVREVQPSSYKDYCSKPFYPLPDPFRNIEKSGQDDRFTSVLLRRRTSRVFAHESLSRDHLAKLLYFTWGATGTKKNHMGEDVFLRKTSPSGGSLHGAEVYPIVMNVEGIDRGIYHYSVRRHGLELLSREDPRVWIEVACGGQEWVSGSAAVFVSTAILYRMAWKYQFPRAFRVVLQDIGHLSQTFCLVATWLGLGSFTTGALRDEVFEKMIGLNFLEEPVLLLNGVGAV